MKTLKLLLVGLFLSVGTAFAATLDETHVIPNAHHARDHASTHYSPSGADKVQIENLYTECASGLIVKSDGDNTVSCQADAGDLSLGYITYKAEASLSDERVLGTQVIMEDTFANRPAAALDGALFYANNDVAGGMTLYIDNGSAWTQVSNKGPFDQGSVLFMGASNLFAEDNDDYFFDDINDRLGIGTATPATDLEVQADAGATGTITASTGELTVVDGDELGRLNFQAPLESDGTDAVLVAASIYAEADDTFSASVNDTDLIFATAQSEAATEKMRLTGDGKLGVGENAPATIFHVSVTSAGEEVRHELTADTTDAGDGLFFDFIHSGTPGDADTGQQIRWNMEDDTGTARRVARIFPTFGDVSSTTMDSDLRFRVISNGNAENDNVEAMILGGGTGTDGVSFQALKTTGDASGKTMVCADANGFLYRSTSDSSCAN